MRMKEYSPSLTSYSVTGLSIRWACLLTTLLAGLFFTPIIWRMAFSAYDYVVHTDLAVKMLLNRSLPTPHFLLHAGIIALKQFLPISFQAASALVVLLAIAATAVLLFRMMTAAVQTIRVAAILTVCLMLVAPIPLFFPLDGKVYFGYIASNVYHNPTILFLKPFALLVFGFVFTRTAEVGSALWKTLTACILATIACGLAKPNFVIVMVPALVVAFAIPALRRELAPKTKFIVCGILLPALILLAWQYGLTYSAEQIPGVYQGGSGIIWAPLLVMGNSSSWLPAKFFLSIAFPLSVGVGYFRQVLTRPRLLLAWLAFVIGAAYSYLLAESGPRMLQGNFAWSGQITLFILFVVSTEFLCEEIRCNGLGDRYRKLVFTVCLAFFILHTLSGINFYLAQFAAGDYCK